MRISHEDMMNLLDSYYQKVLEGIPLAKILSIELFADEHIK